MIAPKSNTVLLKDVAIDMHQGINTVTEKVKYLESGIPILQSKHITKGYLKLDDTKYLSEIAYLKYKDKYQPKVDDVLVCNIGTIGKSLRISKDDKFLIAWNLFLIQLDLAQLHSQYFAHFLNYLADRNYFDQFLTGGTVKFITKKTMGTIEIPLPPLAQQQKIAAILDAADELRQKDKALIAKYDELTQALFLDMFGDPVSNPKVWEFKTIEEILTTKSQNGHYALKDEYIDSGIQMVHMSDAFYQKIIPGQLKRVKCDAKLLAKFALKSADLLLSRRSLTYEGAAKPCFIPEYHEPLIYESSLIKLSPNLQIVNTIFLFYFLSNPVARSKYILKHVTKSTISGINNKGLNAIEIYVPPIKLQNQFAERVKAIEEQKSLAQVSALKSEELFNSLLQKAFNGELA